MKKEEKLSRLLYIVALLLCVPLGVVAVAYAAQGNCKAAALALASLLRSGVDGLIWSVLQF